MSKNVLGADNQQGSPLFRLISEYDPSETTRRAPISVEGAHAYLQGALHDGTRGRGNRIRFSQKYPEWLAIISYLLEICGSTSWMYKEGKMRDVYALETTADFLNFDFKISKCSSNSEKLSYIKGFFDAEGGVLHNIDARLYIQFVQKDQRKLNDIKSVLEANSISCGIIHNPSKRVDPHYWRFFISTRSHQEFIR